MNGAAVGSAMITMVCSFCGIERDYVFNAGMPGVRVCPSCVSPPRITALWPEKESICAFCGKRERRSRFKFRDRRFVLAGEDDKARMCSNCLYVVRSHFRYKGFIKEDA